MLGDTPMPFFSKWICMYVLLLYNLVILAMPFPQWLITEALPNNPKVQEVEGKYLFKPPLPVRDRKSLLKLLRQHDMKGHGGVLLDDIQESLPHCDKVMKVSFSAA